MASTRAKAARFMRGNALGLLALFVALGGTSYAAVKLPKNSVGNSQIKNGAVTSKKIKSNSISTSKIKNRSIEAGDIKAGVIPGASTLADGSVTAAKLGNLPAVRLQPTSGYTQAIANTTTGNLDDPASATPLTPTTNTTVNNQFTFGTGIPTGPPPAPTIPATTLKIPVTGVYNVSAGIRWSTTATPGGIRTLSLGTSTGGIPAGSTIPGEGATLRQNVAATVYLTAGTELYLFVTQNSGVSQTISQSQGATFFAASYVTP
jgi:hypothetical protein